MSGSGAIGATGIARVLRWLKAPADVAMILTGSKSFANPVIGSERLNRHGLHVWRTRLAHRLAAARRHRLSHLVSIEDREAYAADGFVTKRDFLPAPVFAGLVKAVMAADAPAREMREGDAVTRRIVVTDTYLRRVPEMRALLDHPVWRGLTRYVASFDEEPIVSVQTIFGKAAGSTEDPQTSLHMDTFHPTMKAWFFLHDVADDEGPFTYVPGSHRVSARRLAWQKRQSIVASSGTDRKGGAFRLRPAQLARLGWPAPTRFAVPANTLVVGDTCGFHARAHSTKPTMRIEIYCSSRPNPFKPFIGLGLDRVPFLGRQRELVGWWLQDRLAPLGLTRPIWRDAGILTPDAPSRG